MVLQSLTGEAWDAMEDVDFDALDSPDAFKEITDKLDTLYRYTAEVGLPGRCDSFFQEFCRQPKETLNAYVLRHQKERLRLKEAGLEVPDLLAGWHLLTRSAVPPWQLPSVKALCKNDLSVRMVTEALKQMYGGDHVAQKRDIDHVFKKHKGKSHDEGFYLEDGYEEGEDIYYEDDEYYEEYD